MFYAPAGHFPDFHHGLLGSEPVEVLSWDRRGRRLPGRQHIGRLPAPVCGVIGPSRGDPERSASHSLASPPERSAFPISSDEASVVGSRPSNSSPSWILPTVDSRSEKKVASAFEAKGFEVFVPLRKTMRQWPDRVKAQQRSLFECFLFRRYDHLKDRLRVVSTPGVAVGEGADPLPAPVPELEIVALRKVTAPGFAVGPAPYPGGGSPRPGQAGVSAWGHTGMEFFFSFKCPS